MFSLTSSAKPHPTTPFLTNSRVTPPHKLLSKTKSGELPPKRPRRTCPTSGWNGLGVSSGSTSNFWSITEKSSLFRQSRKRRQNLLSSSPKASDQKINSNAGAITRRCSTSMGILLVSLLSWVSVSASPPKPMKKLNIKTKWGKLRRAKWWDKRKGGRREAGKRGRRKKCAFRIAWGWDNAWTAMNWSCRYWARWCTSGAKSRSGPTWAEPMVIHILFTFLPVPIRML